MIKFFKNKVFIIIFSYVAVFCLSEYFYRITFNIPNTRSYLELYLINFMFILLFLFSRLTFTKIFIWLFFTLSIIVNNIHFEVYKSWITSMNYLLAITETTEAVHAGMAMSSKLLIPFLWGALESFLFATLFFVKLKIKSRVFDYIFFICILYICGRSFHTTQQHAISPNPDYSRIKANYFSFGHFIGKILPYHLFKLSDVPLYSHPEPSVVVNPKIKNIILVVGEGQNIQHMGFFGYSRNTTPFFSDLAKNSSAIIKSTYSGGLMTAVALPTFFNAIEKPNGMGQISKGDTNLFKLAKKQNYVTQFFSAQAEREMMIMNIIGSRWIDNLVFPTKLGLKVTNHMPDFNLIPFLKEIDLDSEKNNFIVLHQRGSHQPFGALLKPENNIFGTSNDVDKYDNTILNTDNFLKVIYQYLMNRDKNDWILIFTSDHGQYVTKEISNQGTLAEQSYSVPTLIYSPDERIQSEIRAQLDHCERLFHQQVSTLIISLMGYNLPISDCKIGYINGNLLSGDIGYFRINQNTNELSEILPSTSKK